MTTSDQSAAGISRLAWVFLGFAIMSEIAGAIGLRFSHGFTYLPATVAALAAFATALYVVSKVMKQLPVSIAYPIWAGGGTAGVALIGICVLDEAVTGTKVAGIALVMIGVVLVNAVSEKRSGC